ncbi:hypothetical protein HKX48_006519 [Thoreauomyces humboldtii]|nr:hypothetical protein HKX48_006519 [Thoreauomyces humboldtii]
MYTITNPQPSAEHGEATRFDVSIKVLGSVRLSCSVVFDLGDLTFPPDVLFLTPNFRAPLEALPALQSWRYDDPSALTSVLEQLRSHQQRYTRERIAGLGVESLCFDLSSIEHVERLECALDPADASSRDAKVTIRLPATIPPDETPLVPVLGNNVQGNERGQRRDGPIIWITIKFTVRDGQVRRIDKRVEIPVEWENLYTGTPPEYPRESTLLDYVLSVENYLAATQDQIASLQSRRKDFLLAIVNAFRSHVIEYDDEAHLYASFYFEVPVPHIPGTSSPFDKRKALTTGALVNLHLSEDYPDVPPELFMQSTTAYQEHPPDSYVPETVQVRVDCGNLEDYEGVVSTIR